MSDVVRAAGGLVWRRDGNDEPEVVLVHRLKYDDWSFPKGKLHEGETEETAAVREVEEETRLRCGLGRELGILNYRDSAGRPKRVRYWEMTPEDGELGPANEIDEARWATLGEAARLLTYERDREMLARLDGLVAGKPAE